MIKEIVSKIIYKVFGLKKIEEKLSIYDGYRKGSIIEWKNNLGIGWRLTKKILENIVIYDANSIRNMLRKVVDDNQALFKRKNLYITSFGNAGKSGDFVLYQFYHAMPRNIKSKIIRTWETTDLPKGSTIVFLDDLIGTGSQSVDYINKKLNLMIKPSYDCYLVCLCSTEAGLQRVEKETNFKVISSVLLEKNDYEHLSEECEVFSEKEKDTIKEINKLLSANSNNDYNKGLLLAFTHCVPNNSLPMIWKDKFPYIGKDGVKRSWKAILPREF
jgi:hypothetical protein